MKLNTDICHLPLITQDQNFLKIGNFNIKNSFSQKLLGITFDCKLKQPRIKQHRRYLQKSNKKVECLL